MRVIGVVNVSLGAVFLLEEGSPKRKSQINHAHQHCTHFTL